MNDLTVGLLVIALVALTAVAFLSRPGGTRFVTIHIPERIAKMVGEVSVRAGVTRPTAIACALWLWSKNLSMEEKSRAIREYCDQGLAQEDEDAMLVEPLPPSKGSRRWPPWAQVCVFFGAVLAFVLLSFTLIYLIAR